MNSFAKRIIITFIVCVILVITLFFVINKNDDKSTKNIIKEEQEINKDDIKEENESISTSTEKTDESSEQKESDLYNNSSDYDYVENNNQTTSNYIPVTKFNVKIQNNRLYIGDTTDLITTILPSNATVQEISYQSSNKNVAIVSKTGVITAVNVGECYITITVKNAGSGKLKVTVLSKNNTTYDSENSNDEQSLTSGIVEYSTVVNNEGQNDNNIQNNNGTDTKIENNTSTDNVVSGGVQEANSTNSNQTSNDTISNSTPSQESTTSSTNQVSDTSNNSTTTDTTKNGWYKINNKKYYYNNGKLVKNAYVDYIYLNSNGVAQEKIGSFSVTLYGAIAWANQNLTIREKATKNSSSIGTVPTGGKMTILSADNSATKYIKVKYNSKVGYVYSDYIYINLPDVMPDIIYNITNANKSIYKAAGKKIPNVTGTNLYGYTKKYNAKINKTTYYAPLLYPVAKQLQKAYNSAKKQGYNLKIYDTYRPYDVTQKISKQFKQLYNSNKTVKNAIDYDEDGKYWGPSWFLASSTSRHNSGTALDLTLTNENGKELSAQTTMHTLDARSVRKYNNSTAKKLSNIMTSAGFETLESEWWHFQEDNYKNSVVTSFKLK